jgi:hypothetical protein
MATLLTSPAPRRRSLRWALVGCALLAVCGIVFSAVAAGWWWLFRKSTTEASQPAVEYLVDASARMALASAGGGGSDRLTAARGVLAEIIRPASIEVRAGLRVFGTGVVLDACEDSDLVVPLALANQLQIADRLSAVNTGPSDEAALATAMVQAIRDLSALPGPYTLVVVTGGADSCYPEAGQLISSEAKKAEVELEYFVIGFEMLPEEGEALKGMVDLLDSGNYLPARNRDELRTILKAIQAHIDAPNTQTVSDVLATAQASGNATVTAQASSTALATATVTAEAQGTATAHPPTPTATAASDATAAAAATNASSYAAQTACDHPYLPLRDHATWTYTGTSGGALIVTVTGVVGDLNHATATLTVVANGKSGTSTANCGPEGIRFDSTWGGFPGMSWQVGFGPGWEWTEATGVWLLPPSQLVPGASWMCRNAFANSRGPQIYDTTLVVAGDEPTTMPGGQSVQALRVDRTFSILPADYDVNGSGSDWFVWGVGLVKEEAQLTTRGVTGNGNTALQAYHVP